MSTLKMNWGAKIAVLYIGFVVLIATLVFLSMKQDFQLVASDYYQQEIKYQEVIDAVKNQSTLSAPVGITASKDAVTLSLPGEFTGKAVTGTVDFYAAAKSEWDASFDLSALQHNNLVVPRSRLHPTTYSVKIRWQSEGKTYYQESKLNLNE